MEGSSANLSLMRVLAAVAWADGVLSQEEEDLVRVLARDLELAAPEMDALERLLQDPVSVDQFEEFAGDLRARTQSGEERRHLLELVNRVAAADDRTSPEEASLLRRLRDWLEEPGPHPADSGAVAPAADWTWRVRGLWNGIRNKATGALSTVSTAARIVESAESRGGPIAKLDPARRHFLGLSGALILRVMRADAEVRPEETQALRRILLAESNFYPDEVDSLLRLVEGRAGSDADRQRLCAEFNRITAMPDRHRLLENLFVLGWADGELTSEEELEIRLIANYLWIETQEFVRIRLEARRRAAEMGWPGA